MIDTLMFDIIFILCTEKCNYVMIDLHIESSVVVRGLLIKVIIARLLPGNKSKRAITPS